MTNVTPRPIPGSYSDCLEIVKSTRDELDSLNEERYKLRDEVGKIVRPLHEKAEKMEGDFFVNARLLEEPFADEIDTRLNRQREIEARMDELLDNDFYHEAEDYLRYIELTTRD